MTSTPNAPEPTGPAPGYVPVEQPAALPAGPRTYQNFLRTPRARWWRGLAAIVALIAAFGLLSLGGGVAAVVIDVATGRTTTEAVSSGQIAVTPMVFLFNNLSLVALLPLAMLLQWAFFGARPRWLHSVVGAFRWRWFGRAALIIVPIFVVYVGIGYLVDPSSLQGLTSDAAVMLVVVVVTTPLQAAGEEYGFRGLISRAAGSWFDRPLPALVVGGLVANVAFTIAHFATDPWLIAYYFVFGCSLSVIAWRTGGLEIPVLIHAANNLLLLIPAALFSDLSTTFDRGPGTGGPFMLVPMGVLLALVAVTEWLVRRDRIQRVSDPGQTAPPRTRAGVDHAAQLVD